MSHLKVNIGGFVLRRVIIISFLVRKSDECSWYLDLERVASSFLVKLSRRRKHDNHLQSNQVKRSRRWQTNEFINGKMISFVDSIVHL